MPCNKKKRKNIDKRNSVLDFDGIQFESNRSFDRSNEHTSAFKKILIEFFDASTIHGIKYIRGRPLHEKLWWLTIFCISICICFFQIWSIYIKWKENPVIISIDQKFTSVGEIPFPAVTICGRFALGNETQFEYGVTLNEILEDQILTIDTDLFDLFELTSEICFEKMAVSIRKNISANFKARERQTSIELLESLFKTNISDFVKKCSGIKSIGKWPCKKGLSKILTRHGVCFTFNMLRKTEIFHNNINIYFEDSQINSSGWNSETGYDSNSPFVKNGTKEDYPYRIFTVGKKLQAMIKKYRTTWSNGVQCLNQIRIFVHHPQDFPWEIENSFSYEYGDKINTIAVTPELLVSSSELKQKTTPSQRNCFFENERPLKFFKQYSKSNCELECLTNITLSECGCVLFWMPHFNRSSVCGIKDYKCYTKIATRLLNLNIASASFDVLNKHDIPFKCNCLTGCNSITYIAEKKGSESQYNMIDETEEEEEEEIQPIYVGDGFQSRGAAAAPPFYFNSQIPISTSTKKLPQKKYVDPENFEYLSLKVEFKKAQIMSYKRIAPYQISDFIANCGGLLGLFMGISLLSVVEIIYFFTFRFISALHIVRNINT
uniref:CSON015439 protein n=1 Tax=Culicoides sonorensis TaxID=179676 RepID=A0A336K9E0_CULSO